MKDGPWLREEQAFDEALRNYQRAEAELRKEDNTQTRERLLAALKAVNEASRELTKCRKQSTPVEA